MLSPVGTTNGSPVVQCRAGDCTHARHRTTLNTYEEKGLPGEGLFSAAARSFPKNIPYFILTFVVYPVAGVVLGYLAGRALDENDAAMVVRFVLLWQCALIACLVPFFSSARTASRPIRTAVGAVVRGCGVIAASSVIAAVLSLMLGGFVPWQWVVRSAGILVGFAVILVGVGAAAGRLGAPAHLRQLAASVAAALMLATVFYANPAIAATRGKAKVAVVQAAVAGNPMACVAGSALDYDIMVSRRSPVSFYDNSLIGPDHLYRYPRWWAAGGAYCVVGLVLLAVSSAGAASPHKGSGG